MAELSRGCAAMALAPVGGFGGIWMVLIGIGYYMLPLVIFGLVKASHIGISPRIWKDLG